MPAFIVGDITRLRQVLVNLVGNAVKFTERGSVFVCVQSQKFDTPRALPAEPAPSAGKGEAGPAGAWYDLHFQVKDTGPGISADRMDRLFKLFSQVDTSTNPALWRHGPGLAICRRLVELMGGQIWVESQETLGSKFHFTIQVREAEPHKCPRGRLRPPP